MWSGIYCLHLNQVLYGNLCTIPLQNIAEKFTCWKTHSATFRQFWGQLPLLWLYQSRDSGLLQQTRAWLIAACKRQNAFTLSCHCIGEGEQLIGEGINHHMKSWHTCSLCMCKPWIPGHFVLFPHMAWVHLISCHLHLAYSLKSCHLPVVHAYTQSSKLSPTSLSGSISCLVRWWI